MDSGALWYIQMTRGISAMSFHKHVLYQKTPFSWWYQQPCKWGGANHPHSSAWHQKQNVA
eukprot:530036-Ditylum_brightwellii.AAC.1